MKNKKIKETYIGWNRLVPRVPFSVSKIYNKYRTISERKKKRKEKKFYGDI